MADQRPVILWDIDGTLLEAGNGGLEQYYQAIAEVTGSDARVELTTHGKTDWQVINEMLIEASLPISFAEAVSAQLDKNSTRYLDEERLVLLPMVLETLGGLASADIRNGLLTGNSQARSRYKLVGAGFDPDLIDWSVAFFGSRASKRSDIAISARESLPGTSLLIVGDTPFDGYAANAADIPFLAICTGNYRADAFVEIHTTDVLAELDVSRILNVIS